MYNYGRMRAQAIPGVTVALLLIFLALLLTANEIRYQGCINAQFMQVTSNADHPRAPIGVQKCSRFPFAA